MPLVDLDKISAEDLTHLAHVKREREQRQAEQRAAYMADLLWKPALGAYLRCPVIRLGIDLRYRAIAEKW